MKEFEATYRGHEYSTYKTWWVLCKQSFGSMYANTVSPVFLDFSISRRSEKARLKVLGVGWLVAFFRRLWQPTP